MDPAQTFDALFFCGTVATVVGVLTQRPRVCRLGPAGRADGLDTPSMAYLAGGPDLALSAALESLVARGLLRVEPETGRLDVTGAPPEGIAGLDRAVYEAVLGGARFVSEVLAATARPLKAIDADLVARGLRPTPTRRWVYRNLPLAGIVGLWGVALWGATPVPAVGFTLPTPYWLALLATGMLAVGLFMPPPARTIAGAAALKALRDRHRPTQLAARAEDAAPEPAVTALLIGLFGPDALGHGRPVALIGSEVGRFDPRIDMDESAGCGGEST